MAGTPTHTLAARTEKLPCLKHKLEMLLGDLGRPDGARSPLSQQSVPQGLVFPGLAAAAAAAAWASCPLLCYSPPHSLWLFGGRGLELFTFFPTVPRAAHTGAGDVCTMAAPGGGEG